VAGRHPALRATPWKNRVTTDEYVEQIALLAQSMNGKEMHFDTKVTADTDVVRDLKLDSLASMDFIMALEQRFDTLIPMDSMAGIRTVGDLAALLRTQAHGSAIA
jgi:acyl carrier protein